MNTTLTSFLAAAVMSSLLNLSTGAQAAAKPVLVKTSAGNLVGEASMMGSSAIHVFKGVPYAKPPVGELRWAPPQPIHWAGNLAAREFSLPCLQRTNADGKPNGAGVSGESSEDCLTLNIWAPANTKNAPIMLWLFGGGGIAGSGDVAAYDGSAFARDGVILVTINYRLGALGGFAHPALIKEAQAKGQPFGNYHLLDVMAALKWIKTNAQAFGGDPSNITLFGESAGATMTANLVTSPMAQGLFSKAIIESTGSLPTPATSLDKAQARAVKAMETLGFSKDAGVEELRAIPAEKIILNRKAGYGVRTILDGQIKQQSILDSFTAGNQNDVPLIIGSNSDEGRLRGTQLVATHAQKGSPVFQYFFHYVPKWRREEQPNGAPHAAEIPYVFDNVKYDRRGKEMTQKDQMFAKKIHSCWVAFVKAPANAQTLDCAEGFEWPARTEQNNQTVAIFTETPSLGKAQQLQSPPNGAEPGPTSRP